jgi:hypothetical protein
MKLRIQGNSLRLRLSEAEVQQFAQTGRVAEAVAFGPGPDQTLQYVLAQREGLAAITVEYSGNTVTVCIPEVVAAAWIGNVAAGLSGSVDNGTEKGLKILVEQDQHCSHRH